MDRNAQVENADRSTAVFENIWLNRCWASVTLIRLEEVWPCWSRKTGKRKYLTKEFTCLAFIYFVFFFFFRSFFFQINLPFSHRFHPATYFCFIWVQSSRRFVSFSWFSPCHSTFKTMNMLRCRRYVVFMDFFWHYCIRLCCGRCVDWIVIDIMRYPHRFTTMPLSIREK